MPFRRESLLRDATIAAVLLLVVVVGAAGLARLAGCGRARPSGGTLRQTQAIPATPAPGAVQTAGLPETPRHDLVLQGGRLCRIGTSNLFSGVVVERHETGGLKSRCAVANGVLEGLSECWHTNGQKQVEEHFRGGISHGTRIRWHENGQKLSEACIVDGRIEGTFRRWYDNGVLVEEVAMKANQPDGISRGYYRSGFLKAEVRMVNGRIQEQRYWKDGEKR